MRHLRNTCLNKFYVQVPKAKQPYDLFPTAESLEPLRIIEGWGGLGHRTFTYMEGPKRLQAAVQTKVPDKGSCKGSITYEGSSIPVQGCRRMWQ